jgi:N-acetylneuraminic acid mutarotase
MKLKEVISVFSLLVFLLVPSVIVTEPVSAVSSTGGDWGTKAPLPKLPWGRAGAAVVDGKVYVVGVGGSATYEYDPATNVWTVKAPMPTPRYLFGVATCKNKIYSIGGFAWVNGTETPYSVNEVYDPATDTWQTKQPMPTSRFDLTASVVNGKIYLIGGSTGATQVPPSEGTVGMNEVYDVANDSWTTKEPIPYPVQGYSSAVCDGKIYILGQFSTQIYDPANNTWTRGAAMPGQVVNAAAVATTGVNAPKQIYVFGGASYELYSMLGTSLTQVYYPQNDTWSYGTPMPTAREYLTAAVVDDMIYVIGGSVGLTLTDVANNEVYTPIGYGSPDPSYVPETFSPTISLLSPSATYNVSSVPLLFTTNKQLDWAGYSLDSKQNVTVTGNFTLTNLPNGSHNVTIYANDTFGNIGASQTISFTIAKPEPFPTATVAAVSGASAVVVVGAGLLVYFKKRQR